MDTTKNDNTEILPIEQEEILEVVDLINESGNFNIFFPLSTKDIIFFGLVTIIVIVTVFTAVCAMNGDSGSVIKLIDHIFSKLLSLTSTMKSINTVNILASRM